MRPVSGDRRATFLVAGVQKGGTTALFDYLSAHPALDMPAEKEVHFFDDETGVDWAAPDYGAYHARFGPADGRLRGEATPIYIYWPNSLERIAAYNPDMRLILVFRDPADRAWSHWRMERARGVEPLGFSESIRQGRSRVDDPLAPGCHRVHSYVERGFYGAQVQRLFSLFPRQQVFLGTAHALRADPSLFLSNVADFLDIPVMAKVQPKESHVGRTDGEFQSMSPADEYYLRGIFEDDLMIFKSLTGLEL